MIHALFIWLQVTVIGVASIYILALIILGLCTFFNFCVANTDVVRYLADCKNIQNSRIEALEKRQKRVKE